MAHFYAKIKGARGEASRLGHKTTGITSTIASYQGAIEVHMMHNDETGEDIAQIVVSEWTKAGVVGKGRIIWHGPVVDLVKNFAALNLAA